MADNAKDAVETYHVRVRKGKPYSEIRSMEKMLVEFVTVEGHLTAVISFETIDNLGSGPLQSHVSGQ